MQSNTPHPIEIEVNSSMLRTVAYDAPSERLTLTFVNGQVYAYTNVPQSVVDELLNAESKGQYFNSEIKDAFPYTRVRRR